MYYINHSWSNTISSQIPQKMSQALLITDNNISEAGRLHQKVSRKFHFCYKYLHLSFYIFSKYHIHVIKQFDHHKTTSEPYLVYSDYQCF